MVLWIAVSYLPHPDPERMAQDVDEIYALTAEELQLAASDTDRRQAFKRGLQRAYAAGTDAQRAIVERMGYREPGASTQPLTDVEEVTRPTLTLPPPVVPLKPDKE